MAPGALQRLEPAGTGEVHVGFCGLACLDGLLCDAGDRDGAFGPGLFGAGRGEALKRFLVDDGAGRDGRFWRLAQAFSALYPASTDEKRWIDGVLSRKKSLGF